MRGVGRPDLTRAQEAETSTALENLANEQLKRLASLIATNLTLYYADASATALMTFLIDDLHEASKLYESEAFLDAIEKVCLAVDKDKNQ